MSLNRTIEGSRSIGQALEKVGKVHGWVATLEEGKDVSFEKYKEAMDKRIPVLLEKDGQYTVLVGYVRSKGTDFFVMADLGKTPLEKRGMSYPPKEREYFETLPPDDPERKAYELRVRRNEFTSDFVVSSAKPLVAGITIEPYERSKYRAYFIYNWRESIDAWKPEIAKIVGAKP